MRDFTYYTPTKVLFGPDKESEVGSLLKQSGARRVLVLYGGQHAKRSGLLDRVEKSLQEASLSFVALGGVKPNPRLSLVYEGIKLCKKENIDFILAVGGGSVIDSGKAIAYGLATDGDVWDFFIGKAVPKTSFPVGCVLTIAAAGSEMSNSCVITNEDGWLKRACDNDLGRCKFAILDPELTYSLPGYQTACGCADIMMHVLERYFHSGSTLEITDRICESLLCTMIEATPKVLTRPDDYNLRAEIMWCGSLAHNGLANACSGNGDWAVHLIEHEVGGMFDVTHGAGLTAIWGSWARYVRARHPSRFECLAQHIFGVTDKGEQAQLEGISRMEHFFQAIHMPISLSELGVVPTQAQLLKMADQCTKYGDVGGMQPLTAEDIFQILKASM